MTPSVRARVVDAMVEVLPEELGLRAWCPRRCSTVRADGVNCERYKRCFGAFAERLLAVIERERGEAL